MSTTAPTPNGYSHIEPLFTLELTENTTPDEIADFLLASSTEAVIALIDDPVEAEGKRIILVGVRRFMSQVFDMMGTADKLVSLDDAIHDVGNVLNDAHLPAAVYYHDGTVTPLSVLGAEALLAKQLGSIRIYPEPDHSLTVNLTPEALNV